MNKLYGTKIFLVFSFFSTVGSPQLIAINAPLRTLNIPLLAVFYSCKVINIAKIVPDNTRWHWKTVNSKACLRSRCLKLVTSKECTRHLSCRLFILGITCQRLGGKYQITPHHLMRPAQSNWRKLSHWCGEKSHSCQWGAASQSARRF